MKRILGVALFLCLASSTPAGPIEWAKHHKRFLLMEGAAVAAVSIDVAGLHHCRRTNGVEPCTAHYGAAWATLGITAGLTTIVFPSLAEACWKDGNSGKFCYPLAYGSSAGQAAWGIHQWTIKKNPELEK